MRMNSRQCKLVLVAAAMVMSSFSQAGVLHRLKTTVGLNHVRENVCISLLQTANKTADWSAVPSVYTWNTFSSLESTFGRHSNSPSLKTGVALIKGSEVIAGTMSNADVGSRLNGILRLKTADELDPNVPIFEGDRIKAITFSSQNESSAKNLLSLLKENLEAHQKNRQLVAPAELMVSTFIWANYVVLASASSENGNVLPLILGFLIMDGAKGIQKITPGYNGADAFSPMLDQFLDENPHSGRSFLLISQSTELSENTFRQAMGTLSPSDRQWTGLDMQWSVVAQRAPLESMLKIMGLGGKTIWVHTDLLLERHPNGELELHLLVQFTKSKPKFPKSPRKNKAEQDDKEVGLVPQPEPSYR